MCNHKVLDKKIFYDNFVNKTLRNIDESNQRKKNSQRKVLRNRGAYEKKGKKKKKPEKR